MLPCLLSLALGSLDVPKPVIASDWTTIAEKPSLKPPYSGPDGKEAPVDFAIWQARDKTWQVWSCIRGTSVGGTGRFFYGWEGQGLDQAPWRPTGVKMESDTSLGEAEGALQAPYVLFHDDRYWMFYGDWNRICLATSQDGKRFRRWKGPDGTPGLFGEVLGSNTRDAMVLRTKNRWHIYYTAMPNDQGMVFVRTSNNLTEWSESKVAAYGGQAGTNQWSSECPFVVEPTKGNYYLFRTQLYGPGSTTRVYYSKDPTFFGVNQDEKYLVATLPVAAPEVFKVGKQWYIACLRLNYDGIRLAKLDWK